MNLEKRIFTSQQQGWTDMISGLLEMYREKLKKSCCALSRTDAINQIRGLSNLLKEWKANPPEDEPIVAYDQLEVGESSEGLTIEKCQRECGNSDYERGFRDALILAERTAIMIDLEKEE